ncbi:Importin subunit alpha-1 [Thelohanellus kitauei]|uniref:Importin subunit alpha-1 n=1 Tax=Thelohanellus kitauei TaxID=669202 RepID=A0A0C2N2U6_THEKT|nr:Importin subunit alpha-1 [Thelohanellus kitauei]
MSPAQNSSNLARSRPALSLRRPILSFSFRNPLLVLYEVIKSHLFSTCQAVKGEQVAKYQADYSPWLNSLKVEGTEIRQNETLAVPDRLHRPFIISVEDVPKLVKGIILVFEECDSSNQDVAYQAVFNVFLYVSFKHELFLDKFLEPNLFDAFVNHIVNGETADVKYNAAGILSEMASGDSKHTSFLVKEYLDVPIEYVPQIIRLLNVLIVNKDEYILSDVLSALTHLTDSSCDHVSLLITSGMVDKLLISCTLRVVGNISSSTDEHTQNLLDNRIIIHLRPLLMTTNEKIKNEIFWILSNFAAGTRSPMLVQKIYSSNNEQGSIRHKIIESGVWWLLNAVLECIHNLKSNSDKSIRLFAIHILHNYFEDDSEQHVSDDKISSPDQSNYSDE